MITKKFFIISTVFTLFFMGNLDVRSQSAEAFEEVVNLRELFNGINVRNLIHYKGFTYFIGGFRSESPGTNVLSTNRSLFVRDDITGEITYYTELRFEHGVNNSGFNPNADWTLGDKILRQPYSDKFWMPNNHHEGLTGEHRHKRFTTFENINNEIIFNYVETNLNSTFENNDIIKQALHRANIYPLKQWEQYYTENDVYIYYMQKYRHLIPNPNPDISTLVWADAYNTIVKISPSSPHEPIYEAVDSISFRMGPRHHWEATSNLYTTGSVIMPDSTIWFVSTDKSIVRFDEKTMEFSWWHTDSIAAQLGLDGNIRLPITTTTLFIMEDELDYRNSKLAILFSYKSHPHLLIWDKDNERWVIEEIDLSGSEVYTSRNDIPNANDSTRLQVSTFRYNPWKTNEFIMSIAYVNNECPEVFSQEVRTFIIYNYRTKTARDFVVPAELFDPFDFRITGKWYNASVTNRNIHYFDNERVEFTIGYSSASNGPSDTVGYYSTLRYIIYNPSKDDVSIAETESRNILPTLWFRSLYPNPVAHSRVTANIMCYVRDLSTVELGLYDFMGQKVLDLSNQFEYNQATATIHITFDVPKSLSKGSYFIVVRSGKETRTRGIIVK